MDILPTTTDRLICLISKTQNILRLQGKNFIYHQCGVTVRSKCGKLPVGKVITFTELHDARGIAKLCVDCAYGYDKSLLPVQDK